MRTYLSAFGVYFIAHAAWAGPATAPASAPAPANPAARVAQARRLILEGYYDRATEMLDAAQRDPAVALDVALARVEIDERVGRYREAIQRLNDIQAAGARSPEWHAAMAAMQAELGDYDAAITEARAALRIDEHNMRARSVLGRTLETLGRYDEATTTYKWFETLLKRKLPERADELTHAGRGFLRYSTLTRNPDMKSRCKYVLQEVYQEAFEFVDSSYWPARFAAAEMELEKHNLKDAEEDFAKVRGVNARVAEADVGLARIALEAWNFDLVEQRVRQALQINPNCVAAQVVLAQCRMLERRYADAASVAGDALKVKPRSIEALSLLATAQLRGGDAEASKKTQERIAAINPRCAALQFTLGYWLSAARQYEDAEAAFKQAIALAPWWSEPRTELGLMDMQSGQEADARRTLDASFSLDPYNQQTFNVLGLLDDLEKYARQESEHFVIRYDADKEAVLVPFILAHLERIHGEVCDEFQTRLTRKTTIEMFPSHSNFSVRIAGRPWITTVGACTGPVIALDAPRPDVAPAPFNWADVLRHEFTHTVTLAATGNRIPHWMTEGLAVHQQQIPRSWETCEQLSAALRTGRLFTLETLDWGFMRPRHADDRSLAYAQSEWMIEFVTQRWGHKAVLELLRAFRERHAQPAAFQQVLKLDTKKFIGDFLVWARQQVAAWGLSTDPVDDATKLKATALLRPGDAGPRAKLAEAAWFEQDWKGVDKWSRESLKLNKDEPLALSLLGRLLVEQADEAKRAGEKEKASGRYEEADRLLRRLHRTQPRDAEAVKCLARIEQAWGEADEARGLLETYVKLRPRDPDGYRRLAALCLAAQQRDRARPLLEELYRLDNVDATAPRNAAKLYRSTGNAKAAAAWMQRAVEVGAYDADVYLDYGSDCVAAGRMADAERAFNAVILLTPEDPHAYTGLAKVYEARGDPAKAKEFADKAKQRGGEQ